MQAPVVQLEYDVPPTEWITCYGEDMRMPDPEADDITLTPNPAQDQITVVPDVEWKADDQLTVVLTDLAGKQVTPLSKGLAAGMARMALPTTVPGIYLLRVTHADGRLSVKRLVIAH
jgi:hypothetical protein